MTNATNKVPYEIVSLQLDKLYEQGASINSNDAKAVDEFCLFISEFINACGWTEEEFIERMFNFNAYN